jgi:hypothetical protein
MMDAGRGRGVQIAEGDAPDLPGINDELAVRGLSWTLSREVAVNRPGFDGDPGVL